MQQLEGPRRESIEITLSILCSSDQAQQHDSVCLYAVAKNASKADARSFLSKTCCKSPFLVLRLLSIKTLDLHSDIRR